ncbi:hypothetical protein E3N88_10696 [Mikania micrantha]|uniref:Integrase catalytic domain-containing protein n=1 Tax=Mikania micrantha TaxID=192012 RepID=A0A5N6PBH3_9ASTR|nr:hypothetical protein E3N88_10696 [Mikania micrantha]
MADKDNSTQNQSVIVAAKGAGGTTQSIPKLTGTNYTTWSIVVEAIMDDQGIWEAIQPAAGAAVDERKNKTARSFLFQAVSEEVLLQIAQYRSAKEIWDSLKTRYVGEERVQKARLQTLNREFEMLNMKDEETIDSMLVKKILDAVPGKFFQLVAAIEQTNDLDTMTFQDAVGRLKAYEERLRGKEAKTETQGKLLFTQANQGSKNKPTSSVGRGRAYYNSDVRGRGRALAGVVASVVEGEGHHKTEQMIVEINKGMTNQRVQNQNEANMTQAQEEDPTLMMMTVEHVFLNEEKVFPQKYKAEPDHEGIWYLDNGASNHMTGNASYFTEINKAVTGTVRFGDNSHVNIQGKGSVLIQCNNGEQRLMTGVYYIPSLCSSIISLGQATEVGCKVLMDGKFLWMHDKGGNLLMKVERSENRLYKINLAMGTPICLQARIDDEAWRWHARLGHLNFDSIKNLTTKQMATGIPSINHPTQICESCLVGKHSRQSFPDETSFRATQPLELVHGDLCGPISPATQAVNRYVFLLVDDFNRYMWSFMIKTKDEVFSTFKKFKQLVEVECGRKLKMLRTDRGGEFTSKEFNDYCEKEGIRRQLTAPYTPQQNGVVERRNRTLLETTRSILKSMKVPQNMWGEAVRHSTYVLNRVPTLSLKDQTPYEAIHGRKPVLSHLRVFGCLAFAKIPQVNLKKLDDRSKALVYLGTEPGTKGYRLFDPENKRLVVSRDVKFDETKGWDWGNCMKNCEASGPEWEFFSIHQKQQSVGNQNGETQQAHPTQQEIPLQTPVANESGSGYIPIEAGPGTVQSDTQSPFSSSSQTEGNWDVNSAHSASPSVAELSGSSSDPGSSQYGVKRGPIQPQNDPISPVIREEEGFDDTPIKGFKVLGEVRHKKTLEDSRRTKKTQEDSRRLEKTLEDSRRI